MARRSFDDGDEGKPVVNASGDTVALVTGVRDGTAYVDPDPGIAEQVLTRLGWDELDGDDYALPPDTVDAVTDDEVRLKADLTE